MAHEEAVGRESVPFEFRVETGKVREFARAVHATNTLHHEEEAALAAGYGGVVAPPTFSVSSQQWVPSGTEDGLGIELDLSRVLAGGAEWEYSRPITAGERLQVTTRIADVQHKTGRLGGMRVVVRETHFVDEHGETPLIARSTVIELDHAPAAGAGHDHG